MPLSACPTHLSLVSLLEPLAQADQAALLHRGEMAQVALDVIRIQFVSCREKQQLRADWHSQQGGQQVFLHIGFPMIYMGFAQKPHPSGLREEGKGGRDGGTLFW